MKQTTSFASFIFPILFWAAIVWGFFNVFSWLTPTGANQPVKAELTGGAEIAGASDSRPSPEADLSAISPETYSSLWGLTDSAAIIKALPKPTVAEDIVRFFPDPSLGVGTEVKVWRSQLVSVDDGGETTLLHTWKKTVGEALSEHNVVLGAQDQVTPALDQSVLTRERNQAVEIKITRVQETDISTTATIPFQTVTQKDSTLEKGVVQVKQKGKKGSQTLTYHLRRENGHEVSRQLTETKVTLAATDEIIIEGTRPKSYGVGTATWYTCNLDHAAAQNGLPKGLKVRVVNTANGQSTVVTVVDRIGQSSTALIDLSCDAFTDLGTLSSGRIPVRLEKVYE